MEVVSLIAGICSIPASILSVVMFFKSRKEKNDCLNIKQQIISSNDIYKIDKVNTFDNRKSY